MREKWNYTHEGEQIEVINNWFMGEKLKINGRVVDEQSSFFSATLTGKLKDKTNVRAVIKANFITVNCSLYIDDTLVDIKKA